LAVSSVEKRANAKGAKKVASWAEMTVVSLDVMKVASWVDALGAEMAASTACSLAAQRVGAKVRSSVV